MKNTDGCTFCLAIKSSGWLRFSVENKNFVLTQKPFHRTIDANIDVLTFGL